MGYFLDKLSLIQNTLNDSLQIFVSLWRLGTGNGFWKNGIRGFPHIGHKGIIKKKGPTKSSLVLWTYFSKTLYGTQPGSASTESMDSKFVRNGACTQLPGFCGFIYQKSHRLYPTACLLTEEAQLINPLSASF